MKKISMYEYHILLKALSVIRNVLGVRTGISEYNEVIIDGYAIIKIQVNGGDE